MLGNNSDLPQYFYPPVVMDRWFSSQFNVYSVVPDMFIQEDPCSSSPQQIIPCISCAGNGTDCRFYNRMLRSKNDARVCRRLRMSDICQNREFAAFLKKHYKKGGIPKFHFGEKSEKRQGIAQIAAYVLQCASKEYEKIVMLETNVLNLQPNPDDVMFSFSSSTQVCDVCAFTILNLHFSCVECGLELCIHCFIQFRSKDSIPEFRYKECTEKDHSPDMFHLASYQISLDEYESLLATIRSHFTRFEIQPSGAVCNGNHGRMLRQTDRCYCPRRSPRSEVEILPICVIEDQFAENAYGRFKAHMAVHNPVIVENVDKHPLYTKSLWTLEAFKRIIKQQNAVVLDSRTFLEQKSCSLKTFWNKFSRAVDGEKLLKVKDFPEQSSFAEVAPRQYENLYKILPFSDYTHISRNKSGKGRLNILNMLNDSDSKPDPGPKAYVCFGLYSETSIASTPLHLDVSDAVNFLAVVEPPEHLTSTEIYQTVAERLDAENIIGEERTRCMRRPSRAGAIWKVFHPNDNENLRQAIIEWNGFEKLNWDYDPIHSQDFVVTPEVVTFFEARGIHCKTFIQNEGDVVFIPSGVAHQVQNIFSCIKVAEDFVSLESLSETVKVSGEVRRLRLKKDLTQISTIIHAACSAACTVLSRSVAGRVSSSLKE